MFIKLLILYLVLINIAGFAGMGLDKRKAAAHRYRTPESRLLTCALIGGSVGCILGMLAFRHKTRHLKFTLGLPAILVAQALFAAAVLLYLHSV